MKKILVVDDSETVRMEVGRALQEAGFEVVHAGDGVEGLEEVERSAPALVLLDVNMPRMGGMEMLEELKERSGQEFPPVVLLTTEVQESMILRAKEAGAVGWIYKPPIMELLVQTVQKLAR